MSIEPEYQNYSQINLNAIKNTKLFQKFMQNKSGLISSGSSKNIINPRASGTQRQSQETQVKQKKWVKNHNMNKAVNIPQNVQNQNEQVNKSQKQENIQIKNPFQHQTFAIQRSQEAVKYETFQDKRFERQITQNKSLRKQYHQSDQRQQQIQIEIPRNNNPQIPQNRRKRNFNPNIQSSRNNNQQPQQSYKIQPSQASRNFNDQITTGYNSVILNKKYPENFPQNNLNFYNTSSVQQQNHFQPEQKLAKTQFSPSRNQYPHNYSIVQQKVTINDHNSTTNNTPPVMTQGEYKQKYEALLKKYEELKHQVKSQNKNRKKEFTEWEHQIEIIKQKLFDVQSRQDSLLIENQRLKQKWQNQNLLKMKTQQQNKEIGYKLKELEDQLSMKDNHIKQRVDEANYWKSQSDMMKQDHHSLKLNFEKRNDEYNLLYGDYQIVKKQRDNKDYLLQDLRRNIAFLVEENSAAKDQIFKLITKLYQLEQENQMLKNDLKRQSFDNPQLNNYMKDLQQQSRQRIQSTNLQRPHERIHQRPHQRPYDREFEARNQRPIHNNQSFIVKQTNTRQSLTDQERPNLQNKTRRRGQFARQRGQLTKNQKPQREQRPLPTNQNIHNISISQERQQNQIKQPSFNNNKMGRINQVLQELEKIKDMKAMNGAIRRRKIDLERQLQQLENQ